MFCIRKHASLVLLLGAFHHLLLGATAGVWYKVHASGRGITIDEAMSLAVPGDTVYLADGTYDQAIVSKRDGEEGNPITVTGGRKAIINGSCSSKMVTIRHSFITLKGFSVQGKLDDSGELSSYIKKCVYVQGSDSSPLDGFVMDDLSIQNCGTECVRLKHFVVNAEVTDNVIENCGVYYYGFGLGAYKNGEGIYIGTSSSQWSDGPDECNDNLVKANRISTHGNECVDIKEGATENVVEYNSCSNQLDPVSACYNSRGDGNTFRYNAASDCAGAGARLGGSKVDGHQYGMDNSVYGNEFSGIGNGALKIMFSDQNAICDNTCEDSGGCSITGPAFRTYLSSWDESC